MNTVQIIENRPLPPLTASNQNVPPLTIISKGRAVTGVQYPLTQQLQLQQAAKYVPPLKVIPKRKQKNTTTKRSKKAGADINQPISKKPKTVIVKKYGKLSAPAPFFSQASKIPISTATNSHRQQDSMMFSQVPENSITDAINAYLETEFDKNIQSDPNVNVEPLLDDELIVETADKAVQTDCFCNCIPQRENVNVEEIARRIASHLSLSMDETKKINKITGMMYGLFPIKNTKCLERIDYNLRNTANFEIRLNIFLKHLKLKTSKEITTGFRQLVSDEFLEGRNWDGSKGQMSMCTFEFFNVTVFEAWQNSHFTKDVYVDAMKAEIKKAHDRLSQLKKRKREQGDV